MSDELNQAIPTRTTRPPAAPTGPAEPAPVTSAAETAATEAAAAEPVKYAQDLSRSLSLKENVLITLSSVTPASSVFIVMPAAIQAVGGASATACVIAAVIALFTAFCYAELSSAFPVTGGEYAFAARTIGKSTGFALLMMSLIGGVLVTAVIGLGTGDYLGVIWTSMSGPGVGIVALLVAAGAAVLNIRTNAWVTGVFLVLEMLALVVLTVLGFLHVSQPVTVLWTAQTTGHGGLSPVGAGVVLAAIPTVLFAYNGYGTAVYFAEETRHATSTIGRAIMVSFVITVAAEIIPVTAVLLGTSDLRRLVAADAPINEFLTSRGGSTLNALVSFGIALAIFNALIALFLQIGRLFYSSARDGSWPDVIGRPLAAVHPKLKTPVVATLTTGAATVVVAWLVPMNTLILATGANVALLYVLVALSALAGRRRGTTADAPYRMPLGPLSPLAVLVVMAYVLYQSVEADWVPVGLSVGMLALGYVYYYAYLHPRRDERWTLPAPADEEIV